MAELCENMFLGPKSFLIELYNDTQALEGQDQVEFLEAFINIFEEVYHLTEDITRQCLMDPRSIKTFAVIVRDKTTNSVLAASITKIYIVQNLDSDCSFNNIFFTPYYVIAVYEKARKLGLARTMVEVLEKSLLEHYPDKNIIYFNFFDSPFSFKIFSERGKFCFPSTTICRNELYENFMMKAIKIINPPYTKIEYKNFFVYNLSPPVEYDYGYIRDNYDQLSKELKLFADYTELKNGAVVMAIHPVRIFEGNTLQLEGGEYIINKKDFNCEIKIIN